MTSSHRRLPRAFLAFCVLSCLSLSLGSGFHVYEQGAKASGQAVAFTARADDASAVWYNPANLARFDEMWLSVGASAIQLGDTTFVSEMDTLNPDLYSGGTFDMVDNTGTPAHVFFVMPVGSLWDRKVVFGAGLTTPFGLITEWDLPFDGRFAARKSDLETIVLNVNGAIELGSGWSAAIGLDYIDATLKDFSSNVNSLVALGVPAEPLSNLRGDGQELGWNLAASWKDEAWAFGLSYRSGFDVEIDGNVTFTDVPEMFAGLFPDSPASGLLKLPETWAVGAAYIGWARWEVEADIHKINWSSFNELPIEFENPALTDTTVPEDWEDTVSYRLGASYQMAESHQLRLGAYVETSAIPLERLRPSIPDADRTGMTLGYGYQGERFAIDIYAMHIETQDVTTGIGGYLLDSTVPVGSYETSLDLFGITASFKLR